MRPSPEITAVVVINVVSAILALALTVACSRVSDHSAAADAGHSADHAAASIAHNPDVRSAEAGLRHAGHVIAVDTRKAAAEAKVAAHKLAADTRGAAHGVSHRDRRSDDKSS